MWGKWANNYNVAQLQVYISPWNFKWGKSIQSIQRFERYAFHKVWTQFGANLTIFRPMGKSIWNGQTIKVHNYRTTQFHRTSNGENPSSGYSIVTLHWHCHVILFDCSYTRKLAQNLYCWGTRLPTKCYSTSQKNAALRRPSVADRSKSLIAACWLRPVTAASGRVR